LKDKGIIDVEYSARADLFCLDCNDQLRMMRRGGESPAR
jgi:hypothetical protein